MDVDWTNDEFPSNAGWEDVHNKWLDFAFEQKQLDRYKPRICSSERKSIEAFAEISAAFYFCEKMGCKIIEWEPPGNKNCIGDFTIELPDKTKIFCEVKSPGWERDFVEQKNLDRKEQPKYQNAEVNSYDNANGIIYAIEDSYVKYRSDLTNLLVIVDDFMVPNVQDGYFGVDKALYATKLPKTHSASVNKKWFAHCWNNVDKIWDELIKKGYIDVHGIIQKSFNSEDESGIKLDLDFGKRDKIVTKRIFDVLRFQNFDGLFMNDRHKALGGIACLNVQQPNDIQYYFRVFDNHNAVNRLPKQFITDRLQDAFDRKRG